ncbi:uncharacterized protein METZ01_LOCUS109885 [marine metagenome]|uniref:Uncharacterized protein n=1 Tax=marine metagenome TaxID=408172 RepID=A0A381WXP5_9ZZZZ
MHATIMTMRGQPTEVHVDGPISFLQTKEHNKSIYTNHYPSILADIIIESIPLLLITDNIKLWKK